MGPYKSGRLTTLLIWLLAFGVLAINIYLVVLSIGGGQAWWIYALASIAGVAYLAFSFHLVKEDVAAGYGHLVALLPPGFARRFLPWSLGGGGEDGEENAGAAAPVSLPSVAAPVSPNARQQLVNPLLAAGEAGGGKGEGGASS